MPFLLTVSGVSCLCVSTLIAIRHNYNIPVLSCYIFCVLVADVSIMLIHRTRSAPGPEVPHHHQGHTECYSLLLVFVIISVLTILSSKCF